MKSKNETSRRTISEKKLVALRVTAERTEEIVEEVVVNLRPWIARANENTIASAVRKEIENILGRLSRLRNINETGNPRKVKNFSAKLEKAVRKVEGLLLSGVDYSSFFNPYVRRMAKVVGISEMPNFDESMEETQARAEAFISDLIAIRKICVADVGYHHNFDPAKYESARSAYGLLQKFSAAKITGTNDQPFRIITSLIYESISGRKDVDLKRACDVLLRDKPLIAV